MSREIRNLAFLKRVSALVYPVFTTIFLTTADWAVVAREVAATPGLKTTKGRKPTRKNFNQLHVGRLTAVNSGTEDQDVCDMLNAPEERKSEFREKHDRLARPIGGTRQPEYVDAESTHAFPDDLAREVEARLRRKYETQDIEVVR